MAELGVKIYSYRWATERGLDARSFARLLREQGFSFVMSINGYAPMADSAVESVGPVRDTIPLDRELAAALAEEGVEYWVTCNVFFDPPALESFPACRPIDQAGNPARQVDWYIGICPTCEEFLEYKIDQILSAVADLSPTGVHLGFIRFPGFWELWLPDTKRSHWPEYCFCPRCLARFSEERGLRLPQKAPRMWIVKEVYPEFVKWKTDLIAKIVRKIRKGAREIDPKVKFMLNTLPFRPVDFDGAAREVFGQDRAKLAQVADYLELMTYHQILGREVEWIREVVVDFRAAVERPLVATVQAKPLYLTGMHSHCGRRNRITVEEFRMAIARAEEAGAQRVAVFTWDHLMALSEAEGIRVRELLGGP